MKILSNKKWKEINEQYIDIQLENNQYKEDNENYKNQVSSMVNINRELNITIAKMEADVADLKKETRRLKTLLTKNKISYKKENK